LPLGSHPRYSRLMHALALYLLTVLTIIAPKLDMTRARSISTDIAAVVVSDERAFRDDADGHKTALLLLSIAHFETGKSWAAWIDDGRCNDPAWRATHASWLRGGDCDGGRSYSMWQLLVPGNPRYGKSLVANRQLAVRAALAHARMSLQLNGNLCAYSGERPPHCSKAKTRLETAREWAERFPYITQ